MQRKGKAVELYSGEFNCAQSIIGAFEDKLSNKKNILINAAAGFGGGMGRMQKTCGAVTGAIMILSTLNKTEISNSKEQLIQNIQEFTRAFDKKFGALDCASLISYDLNTAKGRAKAKEDNIFELKCANIVATTVEIITEIIERK
ncbi:MAG: C-GCAxxG-C-C family protein [Bacteroidales bacterium]